MLTESDKEYVNSEYGFVIEYPNQWVEKVMVVEQDNLVKFIYNKVPNDNGLLFSISVTPRNKGDSNEKVGCCGNIEVGRNDQFIYVKHTVLELPPICDVNKADETCKKTEEEYLNMIRLFDPDKHFRLE